MFECPVCLYPELPYPASDYNICPCCGTEFGLDDEFRTFAELRHEWVVQGAKWFLLEPPVGWNPWSQLIAEEVLVGENRSHMTFQSGEPSIAAIPVKSIALGDVTVWGLPTTLGTPAGAHIPAVHYGIFQPLDIHFGIAEMVQPFRGQFAIGQPFNTPTAGVFSLVSQEPAIYSAEPFNGLINVVSAGDRQPFSVGVQVAKSYPTTIGDFGQAYEELAFAS